MALIERQIEMKRETHVLRGKIHWAKVFGPPRMNEFTGEREWSFDLTPDADGMKAVKAAGLKEKLREPKANDKRKEDFLSFRQREFRTNQKTGEQTPNQRIRVTDIRGEAWPEDRLIGNDTVADVKFIVNDNGKGKPKGVYPQAIRVLKHVPYEIEDFAPLGDDDEFFAEDVDGDDAEDTDFVGDTDSTDDLDDDVPA